MVRRERIFFPVCFGKSYRPAELFYEGNSYLSVLNRFASMEKSCCRMAGVFLAIACSFIIKPVIAQQTAMQSSHQYYLFVGTYAPADREGIRVYRFDSRTGEAIPVSAVSGIENPSFLTLSSDHRFLYAVSEMHGKDGGEVYAYAFDRQNGRLRFINKRKSDGKDPCNLVLDKTGKWLFVANYSSGNFSEFPIEADGSVGARIRTIQHHGHSVNLPQQSTAHVHCIIPAGNNRDVFVTDLGLDKVFTYELDEGTGDLTAGEPPFTQTAPGTGPRILTSAPDGKHFYLIHELSGDITVYSYAPGRLKQIQTLSGVPENYRGRIWAADIHLSPDGKFLYASNRDDLNDIVVYSVDENTGALTFKDRVASGGKTPRYFALTPDGAFLLAAHQDSEGIVIFERDAGTGLLKATPHVIRVPGAVCLKMIPTPE